MNLTENVFNSKRTNSRFPFWQSTNHFKMSFKNDTFTDCIVWAANESLSFEIINRSNVAFSQLCQITKTANAVLEVSYFLPARVSRGALRSRILRPYAERCVGRFCLIVQVSPVSEVDFVAQLNARRRLHFGLLEIYIIRHSNNLKNWWAYVYVPYRSCHLHVLQSTL